MTKFVKMQIDSYERLYQKGTITASKFNQLITKMLDNELITNEEFEELKKEV